MPIARTCYFQNLGLEIASFFCQLLFIFANFCLFLPMPNLLFWIDNVNFRFFDNFCLFSPMPNLLFWNLRGGNSKVGINMSPPPILNYDYKCCFRKQHVGPSSDLLNSLISLVKTPFIQLFRYHCDSVYSNLQYIAVCKGL